MQSYRDYCENRILIRINKDLNEGTLDPILFFPVLERLKTVNENEIYNELIAGLANVGQQALGQMARGAGNALWQGAKGLASYAGQTGANMAQGAYKFAQQSPTIYNQAENKNKLNQAIQNVQNLYKFLQDSGATNQQVYKLLTNLDKTFRQQLQAIAQNPNLRMGKGFWSSGRQQP